MSIPTKEQASRFLGPLGGKVTIVLLHDTRVKFQLSRFMLGCAGALAKSTTILDADVFYSTNMDKFADGARFVSDGELLLLPEQGFEIESLIPLLSSKREMLIIDGLNSLYSLASDGRKAQQLAILMKLLSYNARMTGAFVVATAFRIELGHRQDEQNPRSLTALGDILIDTDFQAGSVRLKTSAKSHWPNGELSL